MLLTPNHMCSYVADHVIEEYKGVAAHCAQVQTSGTFDRYVEAARALALERGMPVADAYAKWQAMARCGVDTTALLANGINHPVMEMHEVFVDAIVEKLFE